jgi:hypothetical protein
MVAYNFHPMFVTPIVSYRKRRTIRKNGKRRHARPGESIQLYTGMRTQNCCKIVVIDPICVDVSKISIEVGMEMVERIKINGHAIVETTDDFARGDGFSGANDMHRFWLQFFGPGVFEGSVISWLMRGICQYCGCTDYDCSQCVEAQGHPCCWIDGDHTICSRCESLAGGEA